MGYIDDLKELISLLLNGESPSSVRDGFLQEVRALVLNLPQRFDIETFESLHITSINRVACLILLP